jgi:hypothetical protein
MIPAYAACSARAPAGDHGMLTFADDLTDDQWERILSRGNALTEHLRQGCAQPTASLTPNAELSLDDARAALTVSDDSASSEP